MLSSVELFFFTEVMCVNTWDRSIGVAGVDPGGEGGGGPPTSSPFGGPPNFIKRGEKRCPKHANVSLHSS